MNRHARQLGNLRGEKGLLVAIIARAAMDAKGSDWQLREDAMKYFAGENYKADLQLLGLPSDLLPEGVVLPARKGGGKE